MGAWGAAIFSDDTAADTRDAFTDLVSEGLSADDATARLIADSTEILADEEETGVFWLALAATQWKLGRLIDSVRDRALAIIDSGSDIPRWEDNPRSVVAQRKKHLDKLRGQLVGPQPAPKKLRPVKKSSTDFKAGDVVSYRFQEGRAVRFCVLHLWGDRGGTYCDICLLGLEDETPFNKSTLTLAETLGPHFTMLHHEPAESITILRHGVELPPRNVETFRAWNGIRIRGHICPWKRFPDALVDILAKLGWT